MEEIIIAILANPVLRTFVEGVAIKVIADLLHRRSVDPTFLSKSDAAFAALSNAKNPDEVTSAQNSVRLLLSGN